MYICCLYIAPSSDNFAFQPFAGVFKTFVDIVQCRCKDIISNCGDFNCPSVGWVKDNDNSNILFPINYSSTCVHDMFNELLSSGLS